MSTIRRTRPLLTVIVVCALLGACGSPSGRQAGPGGVAGESVRLRIAASIPPLADLARRVGGDGVVVVTVVPPGASEHTWEPAPRDVARLGRTDVFFQVGLGFEAWAAKLLESNAGGHVVVDASRGVEIIGGLNPHYWLDPLSLEAGVGELADTLARLDPAGAAGYHQRAAETVAGLRALDAEIHQTTDRFTSRKIVTFHQAWDYFARRYGLTVIASIEEFPGKEAGPRHIAEVVRLVKENAIRAVFSEPQFSSKAAEVLAGECDVPVLLLDPLGGEFVAGRGDYFALMRYNVQTMEKALR